MQALLSGTCVMQQGGLLVMVRGMMHHLGRTTQLSHPTTVRSLLTFSRCICDALVFCRRTLAALGEDTSLDLVLHAGDLAYADCDQVSVLCRYLRRCLPRRRCQQHSHRRVTRCCSCSQCSPALLRTVAPDHGLVQAQVDAGLATSVVIAPRSILSGRVQHLRRLHEPAIASCRYCRMG